MFWIKITTLSAAVGSFIAMAILIIIEEKTAVQNFISSWYFSITIALLSGSLGFFLRFLHINYQIKKQMIVNTSLELRDAFIDEMALLQSDRIKDFPESNRANDIVENALPKHHKAVLRYGFFLTRRKMNQLELAWADYSCKGYWDKLKEIDDDYTTEDHFVCYKPKDPHDPKEEFELRKLALKRINEIIKIM